MDHQFNVAWFKTFNIVFNALDNLAARRHVNRMCLAAGVPLIESGTTGFNGQVQVIKKVRSLETLMVHDKICTNDHRGKLNATTATQKLHLKPSPFAPFVPRHHNPSIASYGQRAISCRKIFSTFSLEAMY